MAGEDIINTENTDLSSDNKIQDDNIIADNSLAAQLKNIKDKRQITPLILSEFKKNIIAEDEMSSEDLDALLITHCIVPSDEDEKGYVIKTIADAIDDFDETNWPYDCPGDCGERTSCDLCLLRRNLNPSYRQQNLIIDDQTEEIQP